MLLIVHTLMRDMFDRSISCDVLESNIYQGIIHIHIDRSYTARVFYGKIKIFAWIAEKIKG